MLNMCVRPSNMILALRGLPGGRDEIIVSLEGLWAKPQTRALTNRRARFALITGSKY